ncbi:IclR family transcriptional regulator C-terminal domain-containing protein [Bradyrhizobium sp. TZ2]
MLRKIRTRVSSASHRFASQHDAPAARVSSRRPSWRFRRRLNSRAPAAADAPRTITTQAAFAAELDRVRVSGYAYEDEEHIEGIRCIAAPVFAYSGRVVGSLCVVGPGSRMTRQKLRELDPEVLTLGGTLSKRIGWRRASSKH